MCGYVEEVHGDITDQQRYMVCMRVLGGTQRSIQRGIRRDIRGHDGVQWCKRVSRCTRINPAVECMVSIKVHG